MLKGFVALIALLLPLVARITLLDKVIYLGSVVVRDFIVAGRVVTAVLLLHIASTKAIASGVTITCCW